MRRDSRSDAFAALYAADATGELAAMDGTSGRAKRLATGVWAARAEIDAIIGEVATGWRVERMPAVDRAVLRLAVHELRETDTPIGVVISEAVELAKTYSTARSGAFVNGVLAALAEKRAQ